MTAPAASLVYRRVDTYRRPTLKAAIADALAPWGGLAGLIGSRRNLLLKPNFVAPAADHSLTQPDFYLAVAELLLDHGCRVTIADSPAFGSAALCMRMQGALDEVRHLGIGVLTLQKPAPSHGVPSHQAQRFNTLTIAAELQDYDALINLPKLKVHQQFVFTGATKNLYGCVTGKRKAWRHFVCENNPVLFAQMILANARAANPLISIADGITSLHVRGPRGGQPYPLHLLAVSDDTLAIDWLYCHRIGLPQLDTPLFQALDPAERDRLAALCAPIVNSPDFPVAGPDHLLSEPTPIQFSPRAMVRSVYRSLKTGS